MLFDFIKKNAIKIKAAGICACLVWTKNQLDQDSFCCAFVPPWISIWLRIEGSGRVVCVWLSKNKPVCDRGTKGNMLPRETAQLIRVMKSFVGRRRSSERNKEYGGREAQGPFWFGFGRFQTKGKIEKSH